MTTKFKALLVLMALLSAFAFGRYSSTLTTTTTTEDKTKLQDDTITKSHTITVILKRPDGSSTTTETTDTTAKANITENQDDKSKIVVQTQKKSQFNVSVLLVPTITNNALAPKYGLSITHELIGPVTVGLFGIDNGTIGLSLGLNF